MSARAAGERPWRPESIQVSPGAVAENSDAPPPVKPSPKPRTYALQPPPVQHGQPPPVQHQQPPPVQHRQPPPVQHQQPPPVQHQQPRPVQHQPPPLLQHQPPPMQHQQPPPMQHQPPPMQQPVQHQPPPMQHNPAHQQPPAPAVPRSRAPHYAAQQPPSYTLVTQANTQPLPRQAAPGQQNTPMVMLQSNQLPHAKATVAGGVTANGGNAGSTAKMKRSPHIKLQVGYSICTYWQGILEVTARGIAMVTALVALALAALTISTIDNNDTLSVLEGLDSSLASALFLDELQGVIKNTRGICGFVIFVAVVTLVVESLSTIARFTTSLSKWLLRIFHIADAVASGLLALMFLAGAIGSGIVSAKWNEPPLGCDSDSNPCDYRRLGGYTSATAFAGFVAVAVMIFLAVWAVLNIVKKWDTRNRSENPQTE